MLIAPPPPPASIVIRAQLPPLSFTGFRAGMPVGEARKIATDGKGVLTCKGTTDARMRECNGRMTLYGVPSSVDILVSSIHDSSAVILLSTVVGEEISRNWVQALRVDFGEPNHKMEPGKQESWEWIRRGTMLRVLMHRKGKDLETAITLTYGPLLDRLGPAPTKKPGS